MRIDRKEKKMYCVFFMLQNCVSCLPQFYVFRSRLFSLSTYQCISIYFAFHHTNTCDRSLLLVVVFDKPISKKNIGDWDFPIEDLSMQGWSQWSVYVTFL